jgi:hypothetical protein
MANYYTILDTLKSNLDNDPFINTVTQGDIFAVDLAKQTIFPLCHIIVNNATFESNIIRFNVSVMAMDIVNKSKDEDTNIFDGNDNEIYVLNTMLSVLNRLYEELRRGDLFTDAFQVDGNPTLEAFAERFENYLAGWTMTFDILVPNEMTICDNDTYLVYSQVIDFETTPINSIQYLCDGNFVTACYGTNQNNISDFVAMLNSNPPVQNQACFLNYGNYYDHGDGRVRLQMNSAQYASLCPNGVITLNAIYD